MNDNSYILEDKLLLNPSKVFLNFLTLLQTSKQGLDKSTIFKGIHTILFFIKINEPFLAA